MKTDRSAGEPLERVRRLYDAWNAGDVAGAAGLLSPEIRWETFGGSGAVTGRDELQTTLAGGSSGGTWQMSPVSVDVLVGVTEHVIAFTRRRAAGRETERLEVWTLRDGAAVHYRGFPLEHGLDVLTETTGSRRLEVVCRSVLAFNRGESDEWIELFDRHELAPRERLDDVEILAETETALVISVVERLGEPAPRFRSAEPLYLVIVFEGSRARRVSRHLALEEALAAARAG